MSNKIRLIDSGFTVDPVFITWDEAGQHIKDQEDHFTKAGKDGLPAVEAQRQWVKGTIEKWFPGTFERLKSNRDALILHNAFVLGNFGLPDQAEAEKNSRRP